MHSGIQNTVTNIRQRYWITQIRSAVKAIIHKCVTCKSLTGTAYKSPPMPPLPTCRVHSATPFEITGVDYTGHIFIKSSHGQPDRKVYICLFTCANTRATHLEIVPDLTTNAFLNAFRRFTSRRGIPSVMISDNQTTFIKASDHLPPPRYKTIW